MNELPNNALQTSLFLPQRTTQANGQFETTPLPLATEDEDEEHTETHKAG